MMVSLFAPDHKNDGTKYELVSQHLSKYESISFIHVGLLYKSVESLSLQIYTTISGSVRLNFCFHGLYIFILGFLYNAAHRGFFVETKSFFFLFHHCDIGQC